MPHEGISILFEMTSSEILMCPPEFYQVDYVINPWMEGNVGRSQEAAAKKQWATLKTALERHVSVKIVDGQSGWPDMVFTANAGLVLEKQCVLSRFFHRERRGEEPFFREWFEENGFTVSELPEELPFEGAGDALFERITTPRLWAAYGFRSELDSHPWLARLLNIEVLSVRLVDKRFYHLDTCFCPLEGGNVMYYPPAFDASSLRLIESTIPEESRIVLSESDAVNFAANSVNIGKVIVMNRATEQLKSDLQRRGYVIEEVGVSEFLKGGGACKCLTLRLDEHWPEGTPRVIGGRTSVEVRKVHMEGHLLDSGLLDKALELTVDGGGSFRILHFDLGQQRQSLSRVDFQLSAPSSEAMEAIIGQLIPLGSTLTEGMKRGDAKCVEVVEDGVAPDDFYVTNIYPTEVRFQGRWVRLANQRMDGCIVMTTGADGPVADLKLIRNLRRGDKVVVGVDGIQTVRQPESRDGRGEVQEAGPSIPKEEFGFMGAGVSSERRVELVVRQIAWELHQIRKRHGKVVVVAGPVVIHTGGSEHLAALVREGFVQALLGGNAIAVHDIEQALMGTSLGVDLFLGKVVPGGHRHHLRVINLIRRHGSIKAAVDAGVVTSGVFYECVKHHIPYSLAGSIRDDGPLPDTEMDLIAAQTDYDRLLKGADMVLMLSSMLHSIGVGNMTPAGVRLVCVDINPSVVTKLSDRGSVESIGVVTDVGLFLSLLRQQVQVQEGDVNPEKAAD